MLDAITIGSATVDVFARINKKFSEVKKGDKVLISELKFETGGGGLNAAVGLSRMGLDVCFLGKLGHDLHAYKILHELKKEGISIIRTAPSNKATSYSFVELSEKDDDRIIYTHKGASDDLEYKEVPKLFTKWVYMATMMGRSFQTCEKIAKYCRKNKINLMFNPSSYLAAKGKRYLKKILDATTVLVLNKKEAKLLLNSNIDSIDFLLKSLWNLGPNIVLITEGSKGVNAFDGVHAYFIKPNKIRAVSTAGAGDAFASGFLAGTIKHNDIKTALRIGQANAESVIQYYGAKNRLLNYKDAIKNINRNKNTILVRKII